MEIPKEKKKDSFLPASIIQWRIRGYSAIETQCPPIPKQIEPCHTPPIHAISSPPAKHAGNSPLRTPRGNNTPPTSPNPSFGSSRKKTYEIPAWRRRGHSLTACNAAPPAKSNMAARGPKMADGVWKGVYCRFLGVVSHFR